ncbi:hypothetical protein [Actinomadura rifamycini]|uniref:hypothetical protein n=1 Tax=Actinomadura rifamycini TaxID=31962 RepID=UPI00047AB421|nr:hypothetical protein [Actinomadura rifamycini]
MTTPAGRGTKYDHTQIRDVARQMRRELAAHPGPGSLPDLASRGNVPASAFGGWDAAQALGRTVGHGNSQITRAYQQLLDGILSMADALEKVADNYRGADERMVADIRAVGGQMSDPPVGAPPTRATAKPME